MVPFLDRRQFLKLSGATLASLMLPRSPEPELEDEIYYFTETGHHLSGSMLEYYFSHRLGQIIGTPLTEEIPLSDGSFRQFFTNVVLDRVGSEVRPASFGSIFVPKEQYHPDQPPINAEFYDKYGGVAFFGRPLSDVIVEGSVSYQYTQNAIIIKQQPVFAPELIRSRQHFLDNLPKSPRLLWPQEYITYPLGSDIAHVAMINQAPQRAKSNAVDFWQRHDKKSIRVDTGTQMLTAYEGSRQVLSTAISSGRFGFDTEIGTFPIVKKYLQYEFVSPFPKRVWYDLPDVPWNLLFYPATGEFLHGAYWHSDFGKRHSSGCVNLNLDDASWIYNWAEIGTPVSVS